MSCHLRDRRRRAARPVHPDDLGAQVGQQHPAERTGTDPGQLDDAHPGQRPALGVSHRYSFRPTPHIAVPRAWARRPSCRPRSCPRRPDTNRMMGRRIILRLPNAAMASAPSADRGTCDDDARTGTALDSPWIVRLGAAMVTGPGDELPAAAAGGGRLRVSHAEREQVIDTLKAAFVAGTLAKDEFDLGVSQAFASLTYAELAAVTAGLPPGPTAVQPPGRRPDAGRDHAASRRMMAGATALCAGVWASAFPLPWPRNSEGDPPASGDLSVLVGQLRLPVRRASVCWTWPPVRHARRSGGSCTTSPSRRCAQYAAY